MWFYRICIGLLVSLGLLCSCTPSAIEIKGIFTQNDTLVFSAYSAETANYQKIGSATITASNELQCISIPIPKEKWEKILGMELLLRSYQGNEIAIQSIHLQNIALVKGDDQRQLFNWHHGLELLPDKGDNYLHCHVSNPTISIGLNPSIFYQQKLDNLKAILTPILFIFIACLIFFVFRRSTDKQHWITSALCLYVISFPLQISWGNYALGLLTITALIGFFIKRNKKIDIQKPYYGIIAIYMVMLLGILYSVDSARGLKGVKTCIPLLGIPLLFSIISISAANMRLIMRCFVLFVSFFSLYLITGYVFMFSSLGITLKEAVVHAKDFSDYLLFYPAFSHPSFFSIIIAIAIPIAAYLCFHVTDNKISKIEFSLCSILMLTAIALSGARIGLVIAPLVLVVCLISTIKIKIWLRFSLTTIIFILAILSYQYTLRASNILNDSSREDLRTTATTAFEEKPIFGWGTESMKHLLYSEEIAYKAGLEKPIAEHNHFHNQYLDEIVQFGFIGSIVFFEVFVYLIYLAIKRRDFLLMAYLAIYLPFMFVESPFATVKGVQPMIFWLCFLIATQQTRLNGNTTSEASVVKADTLAEQNT